MWGSCGSASACWRRSVGFVDSGEVRRASIRAKAFAEARMRVCREVSVLDSTQAGIWGREAAADAASGAGVVVVAVFYSGATWRGSQVNAGDATNCNGTGSGSTGSHSAWSS